MKKIPLILFLFSFSMFCTILFYGIFLYVFPFGIFCPVLACEPAIQELGEVNSNVEISSSFLLKNTGNRTLIFESVRPACGSGNDIEVQPFPLTTLLPGEKRTLTILFRPRLLRGNVEKKVVIFSNDPYHFRFILSLKANIIPITQFPVVDQPILAPVL
jgi:hypothetical protein